MLVICGSGDAHLNVLSANGHNALKLVACGGGDPHLSVSFLGWWGPMPGWFKCTKVTMLVLCGDWDHTSMFKVQKGLND